ncbi:hypothetical protein OR1_02931 [Geobacter sp. OR-1]|uniref:hypothetical protein n=1 Tax=Geobacter sp. OR-1 TaxID=1266765 RepID=UPI0005425F2C|nr:hypothetical protein [Geobacter sp. OR-1]GAM10642.1 hypothetical protein OR1_02931 [Geobacter sp. OR-1]
MKNLFRAGLYLIGMLTLLVACGGGGGGGVGPSPGPVNIALAKDKASAYANNSDLITVSATFTPALTAGTSVTFTLAGTARFEDGTATYNTTVSANPANTATAKVKSSTAGDFTITATCTGGTASTTVTFTSTPVTQLSGVVSKGLVSDGTVKAYKIEAGVVTTTQVGSTVTTASDGTYSIDIGSYSGPLMIKVTGGTYLDEATGNTVNLADQAPSGLRAFVGNATSGAPVSAVVTPLTEIAAQRALAAGPLSTSTINSANSSTSTLFDIDNIITTLPVAPSALPSTGAATNAEKYTLNLVAISRMSTGATPAKTVEALLSSLVADIAANGGTFSSATSASLSAAKAQPVTTLSSYSTLTTARGPVFVIASTSPTVAGGTTINFTSTTPGLIRVLDGIWNMNGSYASTAVSTVGLPNTSFPGKAVVYLKCSDIGTVTVKATYQNGSVGAATTSCLAETGRTKFGVYLTSAGAAKLNGSQVSNIRFNIVAGASSNTSSIVDYNSGFTVAAVQQSNGLSTFVNLAPNTMLSSSNLLLTATYGYNPALPSFSVVPIDVNGNTGLLNASDFEIKVIQ